MLYLIQEHPNDPPKPLHTIDFQHSNSDPRFASSGLDNFIRVCHLMVFSKMFVLDLEVSGPCFWKNRNDIACKYRHWVTTHKCCAVLTKRSVLSFNDQTGLLTVDFNFISGLFLASGDKGAKRSFSPSFFLLASFNLPLFPLFSLTFFLLRKCFL